jgi:integral membrane sensor domain MASE1
VILRLLAVMLAIAAAITCYYALIPGNMGGRGGGIWHSLAFATLGFLSRLAFSRRSAIVLLIALGLFGALIEVAQGMLDLQRAMEFEDLIVDIVASVVGIAIGAIVLALYRRLRDRNGTEDSV